MFEIKAPPTALCAAPLCTNTFQKKNGLHRFCSKNCRDNGIPNPEPSPIKLKSKRKSTTIPEDWVVDKSIEGWLRLYSNGKLVEIHRDSGFYNFVPAIKLQEDTYRQHTNANANDFWELEEEPDDGTPRRKAGRPKKQTNNSPERL